MTNFKAGVGFANNVNSFQAGKETAEEACLNCSPKKNVLVLAFCTGKHDHNSFFKGVQSQFNNVPIIGGSAGLISNKHLGYDGYQAGVAVLPNTLNYEITSVDNLNTNEHNAGLRLGMGKK